MFFGKVFKFSGFSGYLSSKKRKLLHCAHTIFGLVCCMRNAMVPGNLRVQWVLKPISTGNRVKKQGILGCHEGQKRPFSLVFASIQGSLL